jgi:hypothetical protein
MTGFPDGFFFRLNCVQNSGTICPVADSGQNIFSEALTKTLIKA